MSSYKILAIDETGKASFNHASSSFILSGLIVSESFLPQFEKRLKEIKVKYFKNPEIVFHSRDMLRRKGPFAVFRNPAVEVAFWPEYIQSISPDEVSIAIIVVDKAKARKLGWNDIAILRRAYLKLLEEFTKKHLIGDEKGKIVVESDPAQDKFLLEAHSKLQMVGIPSEGIAGFDYRNKMTCISLVNKLNLDQHVQIADSLAIMGNMVYQLKINKRKESGLNPTEKMFKDIIEKKMRDGIFEVLV